MKQSLQMLLRDWRAGELRVLAMALVVAVASITSVAFFADRVGRALVRDAHQLLGADLVLVSDHAWQPGIAQEIANRGLNSARATTFISMAIAGENSVLAGVKAVSGNYPLRGRLRIAPAVNAPDGPALAGPRPGTVWIEERLVTALSAPVGSRIKLGASSFEIAAILTLEPERGANFFNIAPRLFMNVDDVAATGLVQTGSRVWHYLYAAGAPEKIVALEAWAKGRMARGQRVENLESGRPEVRGAIERAQRFLGLTALLAAILAGVAIALGTRRFVERHLDGCAVMRCFGATQNRLLLLFGGEFVLLGLAGCALGTVIGFVAQFFIAEILGGLLRADLPAVSMLPALQGFLVGLVLLLGFALPPLVQLKNVPAVRVIRRESGATSGSAFAVYAAGLVSLSGLLIWHGRCRAGRDRGGRFRRGGRVVRGDSLVGFALFLREFLFKKDRKEKSLFALWPRQPAPACARQRDSGGEPRSRAHRGPAPDVHAQRPRGCLAAQFPAGCAQPLSARRPARPARGSEVLLYQPRHRDPGAQPHGARPPGFREQQEDR